MLSVIVPFQPQTSQAAATVAAHARTSGGQVLLSGDGSVSGVDPRVDLLLGLTGKGRAIRAALGRVRGEITVVVDPDEAYRSARLEPLASPIREGLADAVFGVRPNGTRDARVFADRTLSRLASLVAGVSLGDPLSGLRAFRTEALRSLPLSAEGDDIDGEILVKLAAQAFRLTELPLDLDSAPTPPALAGQLARAASLLRYATVQNDGDNLHEGYNTLLRMEAAPRYNAWVGRKMRKYLGRRILEVGAGIGTMTRHLEEGRELVIALEVDRFYVDRLKNLFRDKPHVRPLLSDAALADWEALRSERIDTVVLSNVLEHLRDDCDAVEKFARVLEPGGRLVVLVPALPALYGALDDAVGHFRRYTAKDLRAVFERNGLVVETLEWMNLAGIPGWFVNGRLLGRRAVPALQLRLFDLVAPLLAEAESRSELPVGMSLFAVARKGGPA